MRGANFARCLSKVVVFVWFSMYAMLGVQIFKGGMYRYAYWPVHEWTSD